MLSEKATNDLLGFPNVASQAFFDNILVLWVRTGWTLVWMFPVHHKFDLNINLEILYLKFNFRLFKFKYNVLNLCNLQ